MNWQIGSSIGMYIMCLVSIILSYIGAAGIDAFLYQRNKYNEDRNTVKLKRFKWFFWHSNTKNGAEIFRIALIYEIISILLFFIATTLLIISILLKNEIIIFVIMAISFMYMTCVIFTEKRLKRKYK